ncbi:MAG: response regulator [Chloroflexota bacterium]
MIDYSALIIDDDIWMQRILSKTMQSYGFRTIHLASNGFDGVALAVERSPHIIILDILMPELSGHLTIRLLKAIKMTRDIPVLMISALSDVENLGLAVKSGTAGFISKPFTRATVLEKLTDIYGKEKLDLISRGEPIDIHDSFPDYSFDHRDEPLLSTPPTAAYHRREPENEESAFPRAAAVADAVTRRYQDEEKRSIESIKKLLLRTNANGGTKR